MLLLYPSPLSHPISTDPSRRCTVAEQERKTKAERRAEARAERKRAEEEAARRAKKQSVRNGVIVVAVIAVIALVMVPAISGWFGGGEDEVTLSLQGALEARESAGCEMVVNGQPLPDSTHHDPANAPPADVLYGDSQVRPTHSGPHFAGLNQALGGVPSDPLDERATTHNLEHGSVIAWFDPDTVESGTADEMEDWMRSRQDLGFESNSGGNIFVSPYPEMTGDKPIALRAWGYALNCDAWDQEVADSFLIDYWGTHGQAPERNLSPYPRGSLGYEGEDAVEDNTEAPIENDPTDGATDGATTEAPSEPAGTDDATTDG